MSSLAIGVMARLAPSSINHLSVLQNRNTWASPIPPSRSYAKSAEEILGLNKPKRPPTPFITFVSQMRSTLKSKNPDSSPQEILQLASKHWEQVGQDVKDKMAKEYQVKADNYAKLITKFKKSLTLEQTEEIQRLKEELVAKREKQKFKAERKSLGRPKKPPTSYMLFALGQGTMPKKEYLADFQRDLGKKWKAMSDAEKEKWTKQAKELMDKYKKDMEAWEKKMIEAGNVEVVRSKALKPKKLDK